MITITLRRAGFTMAVAAMLLAPTSPVMAQDPSAEPAAGPTVAPSLPATPEGRWTVTSFDPWGEGTVEPLQPGQLVLSLLADGQLEGTTGCGRYLGGWALEAGVLHLGVSPTGHLGCADAETGEAIAFEAALDSVAAWRLGDSGMELLDVNGSVRVALAAAASDPSGAWDVVGYRRPNGRMTEPPADAPMWLDVRPDGELDGSTGCRLLEGIYQREGASMIIGPVETVGLPCEGEARRAERQLLRALGEVIYWQREGQMLSLSDGFDEVLVKLTVREAPASSSSPASGTLATDA